VELTRHGGRTVQIVAKELGLSTCRLCERRKLFAPTPGVNVLGVQTPEQVETEISWFRDELLTMREPESVQKIVGYPLRNPRERHAQFKR
jgi:hypothetical protein